MPKCFGRKDADEWSPTMDSKEATPMVIPSTFTNQMTNGSHDVESCLTTKDEFTEDAEGQRGRWASKREYMLAMVGYCVGIGNVWRFPYVCIRNGGGAFLIPYLICLTACGLPLYLLEVAMGQFLSKGPFHVWCICPLFKGIGYSTVVLAVISCWYYVMLIAYTLIYLAHSVRSPLPWTLCGQSWNTDRCVTPGERLRASSPSSLGLGLMDSVNNGTSGLGVINNTWTTLGINGTVGYSVHNETLLFHGLNDTVFGNSTGPGVRSSSHEFWVNNVLELSPGLDHLDGLPWHTAVALLVASGLVLGCVIKGVNSVGKVVYVTATLPYILLTVLIVKGATLQGAVDGVIFYLRPDFSKVMSFQTWVEASLQVFYSLGPVWGGLFTMASYNKFSNNCARDAVLLSFACEGTSVYAGFAIFTVLGHMAYNLGVPVAKFTSAGMGLAFVVYPEAVSYLPLPQLWGVLFFLMLFTLGLDSQFVYIETVVTTIHDLKPKFSKKWSVAIKVVTAIAIFLLALPLTTRGGMYIFQLVDWYIAAFTAVANGLLECLIIAWIYGADRFMDDIEFMTGRRPYYILVIMWRFVTPTMLIALMVTSLLTYSPPEFEGYSYTLGGVVVGWLIATVTFVPVPVYAIYLLAKLKGGLLQRLKVACTPSEEWKPGDLSRRADYKVIAKGASICQFRNPCSRS